MSSLEKKLTCEEIRFLISRSLDGDLSGDEARQLYLHLKPCSSCSAALEEMAKFETNLETLNQSYKEKPFSDSINEKIMTRVKHEKEPIQNETGLLERAFSLGWIRPAFSGFAGAIAGLFLFFLVYTPSQDTQRFQIHPVEFQGANDKITWNQTHTLLPGHTLHKTVIKSHDQSYHFRFQSDQPVDVVITHNNPKKQNDSQHKFTLHGIRYSSLTKPQQQDEIVIRNEGDTPIHISSFSDKPDGIRAEIKENNKTA